jgi:hypothetical protein
VIRIVSLSCRQVIEFFLCVALMALTLVGFAGAASSGPATKFSAHLTATTFTSSQAGSIKLIYRFSSRSESFSYRLSIKKGSKWQVVRSATSAKKGSYFEESRTTTVKKLFAGKAVRAGDYRLKLSVEKDSTLLDSRSKRRGQPHLRSPFRWHG